MERERMIRVIDELLKTMSDKQLRLIYNFIQGMRSVKKE